eukprot:723444-Pleurochrysis_carterae.AAC.1
MEVSVEVSARALRGQSAKIERTHKEGARTCRGGRKRAHAQRGGEGRGERTRKTRAEASARAS